MFRPETTKREDYLRSSWLITRVPILLAFDSMDRGEMHKKKLWSSARGVCIVYAAALRLKLSKPASQLSLSSWIVLQRFKKPGKRRLVIRSRLPLDNPEGFYCNRAASKNAFDGQSRRPDAFAQVTMIGRRKKQPVPPTLTAFRSCK